MESKLVCLVVLATLGCAGANPANFEACAGVDASACTVESVDITPCKRSTECVVKRGTNSSIVFDYTPNFAANKVKTLVYSVQNTENLAFSEMDTDGCKFTSCPVVAGTKQQLNYPLYLGKKLPKGHYTIKWTLWNEDNEAQICCFTAKINLR